MDIACDDGELNHFFLSICCLAVQLGFCPLELGHQHFQVYAIQSGVFVIIFRAVGVFTVFLIFSSHNQGIIT